MAAVLAATLVVAAGVQGLVGLGLALVAAPVVALVAPQLMPELLLWLTLVLPLVTLVHEHHEIDWRGLAWSFPARIPGTAVGVGLVTALSTNALDIVVAVVVLLGVLLTSTAVRVPVNWQTLSMAGFVSGVTGTTTSIGGPPIALLYQHRSPEQIRSTLALSFIIGAVLSLVGLGLVDPLEMATFLLAMAMMPALVLGFVISRLLDRMVPRRHIRTGVLLVSALSAIAILVRSLLAT